MARWWRALCVAVMAGLAVLAISWSLGEAGPRYVDQLYLADHPVVVASDRLVCSMAGPQQESAGIAGKDGSHSVAVDGVVFWNFGDTKLERGGLIPNSLSWSADTNAADCITLVPKGAQGRAASLLPGADTELTVWPLGMEATSQDTVHFFYASIVGDGLDRWEAAGVGLASFDTETLIARRAFGGALPWPAGLPQPKRTVVDGDYVYILLGESEDEGWQSRVLLGRVPISQVEELAAYEYWQPAEGLRRGAWVSGLWNDNTGTWGIDFEQIGSLWLQPGGENGIEVAYNEYLDRWIAIYATGFMTSISLRSSPALTGAWDGPETTLIDCPAFHASAPEEFLCYSGAQQEVYERDGGRTIYASYSNGDDYEVFLHEIRFAAPVYEWQGRQDQSVYVVSEVSPPGDLAPMGTAFYASDIPVPGFVPIHRWIGPDGMDVRYGPIAPNAGYRDLGVDFYAPADEVAAAEANALYEPVYRWVKGSVSRYSPLNLALDGYVRMEEAFYAACPDGDGDGLTDCDESFAGSSLSRADTDGDGLQDGYEQSMPGCDPLIYNDDRDGKSTTEELLVAENPCVWGPGVREVIRDVTRDVGVDDAES